jgi:hypothetical protein
LKGFEGSSIAAAAARGGGGGGEMQYLVRVQ